jgi:uncharacterized HAD superfamily protein
MRLGIDFDGTVTDAPGMQRAYAVRRWGVELSELQVMRAGAVPVLGEERYASMGDALWGPLTAVTPPQKGALRVLGRLVADHEVDIITARHGNQAAFARRWLAVRGIGVRVVNTSAQPKIEACARLGIDVLLDDDILRQGEALLAGGTLPVLYEHPHNRDAPRPEGMRSVASWGAFANLVQQLEAAGPNN